MDMTTTTPKPLTDAQRARKVAAAKKRMLEAKALLIEVCNDYSARSYTLSLEQQADWRAAVDLVSPLERMDGLR
jgi:hypothetical protein